MGSIATLMPCFAMNSLHCVMNFGAMLRNEALESIKMIDAVLIGCGHADASSKDVGVAERGGREKIELIDARIF